MFDCTMLIRCKYITKNKLYNTSLPKTIYILFNKNSIFSKPVCSIFCNKICTNHEANYMIPSKSNTSFVLKFLLLNKAYKHSNYHGEFYY